MPRSSPAKPKKGKAKGSIYGVHPGVVMMQDWVAALKGKTGRSLDEWIDFVKTSGPATEPQRRDWLKNEHKLGTNTAWWIAERTEGKGLEDSDSAAYLKAAEAYVEAQYAGPKAALKPIYHRLLEIAFEIGDDVKACPCKTIVPLYRRHVFAQLKPTTLTRIDLGFALKDTPCTGRLVDTGGFAKGDRISHRIPISSVDEIDAEVRRCLKKAYDMDAQ